MVIDRYDLNQSGLLDARAAAQQRAAEEAGVMVQEMVGRR